VGSVAEMSELAEKDLSELDLHRPFVDEVEFPCPECDGKMKRVLELIDVWFDSGAMPVAQWHYPFENEEIFKQQFPADYICEAVDQTRGWFYSLHAISTLLFEKVSFRNVLSLGLILDGDGLKMSKSRGTVIDPWDVINEHGADAFRWYLYTASPPGQERRFSVDLVGEVMRNFTLTLWNVYSFFVTYARLDEWKPEPGGMNVAEVQNELDRWLLSELNTLTRDVTASLDTYDVLGATRPIQNFVDTLSKWYLRRSRRRFWKSESDADKETAYATLYTALTTISKLLAPTMPFLAEELYQNLVTSVDKEAPESVHLADWPVYDKTSIDETLNSDMRLVMRLASLGHSARNQAAIKVRQPLAEAAFSVRSQKEVQALEKYAELLSDELNVKKVSALSSAGEAVSYSLNPLPKQLGQKYQSKFPEVRKAILAMDAQESAQALLNGEAIKVTVDKEDLEILPDEIEVRAEARSGLEVASEGAYLAALKTDLTPELVREGLAREFVRRVQDLRKQADFDIADRIYTYISASENLAQAIEEHRDYIMGETLTLEMRSGDPLPEASTGEFEFDGEQAKVGLVKA
jgi:isoleucyl-tRNA synthetase